MLYYNNVKKYTFMKKCSFAVEAFFGVPMCYENWYEYIVVELTDEQFTRYCETTKCWESSEEYKTWNMENGENFFIKRDLPDVYTLVWDKLVEQAPLIWDERIVDYLDQVNIYTAEEIWDAIGSGPGNL